MFGMEGAKGGWMHGWVVIKRPRADHGVLTDQRTGYHEMMQRHTTTKSMIELATVPLMKGGLSGNRMSGMGKRRCDNWVAGGRWRGGGMLEWTCVMELRMWEYFDMRVECS